MIDYAYRLMKRICIYADLRLQADIGNYQLTPTLYVVI